MEIWLIFNNQKRSFCEALLFIVPMQVDERNTSTKICYGFMAVIVCPFSDHPLYIFRRETKTIKRNMYGAKRKNQSALSEVSIYRMWRWIFPFLSRISFPLSSPHKYAKVNWMNEQMLFIIVSLLYHFCLKKIRVTGSSCRKVFVYILAIQFVGLLATEI